MTQRKLNKSDASSELTPYKAITNLKRDKIQHLLKEVLGGQGVVGDCTVAARLKCGGIYCARPLVAQHPNP